MDKDLFYKNVYYTEMQRFIYRGYAVKVNPDFDMPRKWYFPHFGVRIPNKPNKIRLILDAAAKTRDSASDFL